MLRTALKWLLPHQLRKQIRNLYYVARKPFIRHSTRQVHEIRQVARLNTRESYEYVFAQEQYIHTHYLNQGRLSFLDEVGSHIITLIHESYSYQHSLRIIDIGCGTGHLLKNLYDRLHHNYNLQLFGVDFASSALNIARKTLPQAQFIVTDIYNPGLNLQQFDIVLCTEVLEHLEFPESALQHLVAICKLNGQVIITVPNGPEDTWEGHINHWDIKQFQDFVSKQANIQSAYHVQGQQALFVHAHPIISAD